MGSLVEMVQSILADGYGKLASAHRARQWDALIRSGVAKVGVHTYGVPVVYRFKGNDSKLHVGAYTSITNGAKILLGGNHPAGWVSTFPFRARLHMPGAFEDGLPSTGGDVRIGSDVWIGLDAIVLSGVTIGHGAVVSAGALVNRDVEPYAIVGGVPAKTIKRRFSMAQIEAMLQIQWWDWDEDKLRAAVPLLSSDRIDAFIARYTDGNVGIK